MKEEPIVMESGQANAGIMGGCPTLNASHEQPIMMSDRKGHNGITEDGTATTLTAQEKERPIIAIEVMKDATAQNEVLQALRKAYGAEAVLEWCSAIMERVQQADILQQGVYEGGVQIKTENGDKLDDDTLPRPELVAEWLLRDMRQREECGCTPQGWESSEQSDREPTEALPKLPYEDPSSAEEMLDMWRKGERLGLLQQALHQIQEVRKSTTCERTGGGDAMTSVVRRLTPLE